MSDCDKKDVCPRLIDYVAIIGRNSYREKSDPKLQSPQLLRRYPSENHNDFPLPLDMVYFCQPEGCIFIKDSKKAQQIDPFTFIFSLTDKDSSRTRFGVCLNFYRPLEKIRQKHQSRKNSVCEKFKRKSSQNSDLTSDSDYNPKHFPRHRIRTYSLTSLCIISHHMFFTAFRDSLNCLKRIIDACKDSSCFKRSSRSRFRHKENVWSVLTGQITEITSSLVMHDIREIETWISRLLSAPVPVPGKTRITLKIFAENEHDPPILALPDHKRFSLVDYPVHLPIELLGVDNFIKVITLIVLENKIIFQSRNYNALSMSIMAFVTMIYPLEYMFPIIPLLPTSMSDAEQLLFSPTPYIIGIPASFSDHKHNFRYPDDIWLVDLDSNTIRTKNPCDIPSMPDPEVTILKDNLIKTASNNTSNSRTGSISSTTIQPPTKRKSVQENGNFEHVTDSNSIDVAIRVSLVQFFNSPNLLANFSEHTRTLKLYPRPVVAFQVNSFLRSRDFNSKFIYQFAKTQAVEYFAEWSLTPNNVAYLRVDTNITDAVQIGDKSKWFKQSLEPIEFEVWDSSSSLNGAIKFLRSNRNRSSVDQNISDSDDELSSKSSNEDNAFTDNVDIESTPVETNPISPFVYQSPSLFHYDKNEDEADDSSDLSSSNSNFSDKYSDPDIEISLRNEKVEKDKSKSIEKTTSFNETPNRKPPQLSRSMSIRSRPNPPISPNPAFSKQPKIGNVFSKKQSTDEGETTHLSTNIFKHMASQAKELIKQETRQDSQTDLSISPLEQLTLQAKKVAEKASESVHDVGKTALEVSKSAADVSKNTLDDLTFVSKSKIEDITQSAKNVVHKTHLNEVCNLLMDSFMFENYKICVDLDQNRVKDDNDKKSDKNVLFSNIGSDFKVLKSSTSTMFSDFFKGNKDKVSNKDNNQIEKLSIVTRSKHIFGPFSAGTKGVIEKSDLIKHSSKNEEISAESTFSNEDNQEFAKDCLSHILNGEGLGWLKLSRLKKLLEDESFRNLVLGQLNLTLVQKIPPDDSIDDVCISKSVWKGMLKVLLAVVHGLEITNRKFANGGLTSTFQLLEICHTHYWSKFDLNNSNSKSASPFSSNEHIENSPLLERKASESDFELKPNPSIQSTAEMIKDLLNQKRKRFINKLTSMDSDNESTQQDPIGTQSPRRGSITSGPAYVLNKLGVQSPYRLTSSDTEAETSNIFRNPKDHSDVLSNRTSYSSDTKRDSRLLYADDCTALESERYYLYEGLLGKNRSGLWDQMQFWEDVFFDVVSYEREVIGLDQGAREMMIKYKKLNNVEKKRLEHEEDRLLSTVLYNVVSMMIMLNVNKIHIKTKVRRLLGKCHISMIYSKEINHLLDNIDNYNGNDIDLKPRITRLTNTRIFTAHVGSNTDGDLRFIEVRDDGLIIRSEDGVLVERWWFERLVNMTYSPKTKVLCLWKRNGQHTALQKYYAKKCRNLYYSIKDSIEKSGKMNTSPELGGEFPVQDVLTGECGLLQICIDGVGLLFMNSKADKICYAVLCVFSYVAAGQKKSLRFNDDKNRQLLNINQDNKPIASNNDESNTEEYTKAPPSHPAPILYLDEIDPPPVPPRLPPRTKSVRDP